MAHLWLPTLWAAAHSSSSSSSLFPSSSSDHSWFHSTTVALICSIAMPVITSVVYVVDKVAVSRRVRHTASYIVVVGIVDILEGLIFSAVTRWQDLNANVRALDFVYALLAGLFFGVAATLYVFALEGADVSRVIGLQSVYPLLVAVLSWLFLHEVLGYVGYIGIAITVLGALCLSLDVMPLLVRCCCKKRFSVAVVPEEEKPFAKDDMAISTKGSTKPAAGIRIDADDSLGLPPSLASAGIHQSLYGVPGERFMTPASMTAGSRNSVQAEEPKPTAIHISMLPEDYFSEPPDRPGQVIHGLRGTILRTDASTAAGPAGVHTERSSLCLLFILIPLVVFLGLNEFFLKLATERLPPLGVSAITYVVYGSVELTLLIMPKTRKHFFSELKANWKWPLISETLMLCAQGAISIGMAGLPAPIVSSIAASCPFFTLVLEFILRIADDNSLFGCVAYKLAPISVTVAGVVLLSYTAMGQPTVVIALFSPQKE